jgi:hypothetical protein
MAETIKKHKDLAFIVGIGLFLTIAGILVMSGMIALPSSVSAATETVVVTATVAEYLTFTVSPTSTTLSPNLIDSAGALHIASTTPDIIMGVTTNAGGFSITLQGANAGLATTTAADPLIETVSVTSTVATGTDAYGANATSSTATIGANYDYWGTDTVGEIASSSAATLSTDTSTPGSATTTMEIKAACDVAQEAATYTDTITLTVTGS